MSTIVLLEDSRTQGRMISDFLRKNGFTVKLVGDGIEGLEQIQQIHPDLVISDIDMPGLNGYEVCRKLRKNPDTTDIPVLICSASPTEPSRFWSLKNGANGYLSKPFHPSELLMAVQKLIKRPVIEPTTVPQSI